MRNRDGLTIDRQPVTHPSSNRARRSSMPTCSLYTMVL